MTDTNSKITPSLLWEQFRASFAKNLWSVEQEHASRIDDHNDRKYFLKEKVLPAVAKDLQLEYSQKEEFLRVDYTMFKHGTKHKWLVPMIAIESENNFDACYQECGKLASINCPLKVLINYGVTEEKERLLTENDSDSSYILDDFMHDWQLVGWYTILIYDNRAEGPRFNVYLYNEKGERLLDKEQPIIPNHVSA